MGVQMTKRLIRASVILGAMLVSGCAGSLSPGPAFQDVALSVQERTGKRIVWDSGSDEDQLARNHIDHLLKKRLTANPTM